MSKEKTEKSEIRVKDRPILRSKIYLYMTEFFAGMSVMAVELGASRLMAPYFSSSQIVWTIIIGTIMIAMALGNIMGGRWADKDPNPDKLYGRIVVAAIWIALIPVVGKYIILAVSALLVFTVSNNFLIIAAFVACMVIFVFPLFLLGTVTPSLVKYTVDSLDDSGKVVGYLNASNTVGSIIGTFVPTFISIPAVGTNITFLIFSGILMVLAIVYFVTSHTRSVKAVVGSVILILACIFGHRSSFAFWQSDLTFEGESIYNYLQVYEDDRLVSLSTNVLFGVQSIYSKAEGLSGMYYDYAMAAPYMAGFSGDEELDVLVLGNGTGTFATQVSRYFENASITGVEIDEKITDLAHEYFELPETMEVVTYDGRAYLQCIEDDRCFDVIMVDAYQDITIPFQMSSVEFFNLVKQHLNPGGVMVVNMNMRSDGDGGINEYLADTISSVFSEVYTVDVSGYTNRELFASNNTEMLDDFNSAYSDVDDTVAGVMDKVYNSLVKYEAGDKLLTDDKAPVELLGMKAIDAIIVDEVSYYKEVYENEGLEGLLESF